MLKIPVDGGKYTIEQDDGGTLRLLRYDEPWMTNPPASKMLVSVAYELGVLRRIVAEAVRLDELIHVSDGSEHLQALTRRMHDLLAEMEGYTDFRRHLAEPGEI